MPVAATNRAEGVLERWLDAHIARRAAIELISASFTLLLALGSCVLALGILAWWIGPVPELLWLVPVGFVLTFATYPFVTPRSLPFMSWLRKSHDGGPVREFAASPFSIRFYFWDGYMALSAIYWAPLFFHMAFEEFGKSMAIRALDRPAVLGAIRLLVARESRVPWYELESEFPALPLTALQRQLSLVEGVVFLSNEPAGATLTDSLREEIRAAL